jgi:DNA-binding transcriptional LysR family regulator
MLEMFAEGSIDLAFALEIQPPEGLERLELSIEEVAVVMSPEHPLAKRHSLTPALLTGQPLIAFERGASVRWLVDDAFERAGVTPEIALECNDLALVRSLVAQGIGLAIIPRSFAELPGPEIAVRRLQPRLRITVALWWRRGRHLSPAARAFVEFARARRPAPSGGGQAAIGAASPAGSRSSSAGGTSAT